MSRIDTQSRAGEHPGRTLLYRPGLDGLRALAVAGVFLYHANVSWAPGGFTGVDLFFVLSGYLITSLLLAEHSRSHRIDLWSFWGRRARRLLPAVLVVIAFALLAAATIARDDLARTRADALSAVVYLTNWHEILASHSYFNSFGRPSLLEHLWSLAIEEQFYVFWPLILIVGLRRLGRARLVGVTAALAVGSCALMWLLYNPDGDPSRVYYGTDTRAFALLIGALLAFASPAIARRLSTVRRALPLLEAAGVISLLGVLAMFGRVQDYSQFTYRGGLLIIALAAAALIAAIIHPATVVGRAFGWRPLRWIGVRSYGIYLWHWPILQLTRPGVDVPWHGPLLLIAQAAVTVAAAALSYRYVEMPIRTGAAKRRLRGWLDRYTPHQRLGWVTATLAVCALLVGVGFGVPAPVSPAIAHSQTATADALLALGDSGHAAPLLTGRATAGGQGGFSQRPPAHAPKPTHRPGALPSGPILAVGDSVLLGCAQELQQRLGSRLTVDAAVGRQAADTIARLAQYRADGRLPGTVVVQIGDNGPVWYADMQHLRGVLAGVTHVVLVNVRVARSWQGEVNRQLAQYVRTWPQAVLANWYASSTQAMLTDGVHPSVAARKFYVRVVIRALKATAQRSNGHSARRT